jgi:hypothetical protein
MRRCGKILGRIRLVAAVLVPLCVASSGWAQGSRKDDVVFGPQGRPAAGATITVCAASATGTPCSPLASLYTDATLTVSSPNPFTTDGLGNYHFYAAPGRYQVQVGGPGITTYTLSDVILPSDPSSMASGNNVSAFGLTLGGNLNVAGNASVAGSLAAGTFSPSSLAVQGNASFAGPRPAVYVTAPPYNAKGDSLADDTAAVQAAVTAVCSNTATGGGTLFFPPAVAPSGYYRLTQTQTTVAGDSPFNRVAQVTIPASTMVRTANVVVFTPGGTPFSVAGGPGTWYTGEGVTIAGATDSTFNGTWPITAASSSSITFYQSGATLANATSGGGTATTNSPVIDLSLCAKNGTAIAIDAGNSIIGTSLQFSQAPQTRIIVQTPGASPNTAPVFLVTGNSWSLSNLSIQGYNQAVQVNNVVEYISKNMGYASQCSGQILGGITDNVPLAIYSSFWVAATGGVASPASPCANSLYGIIWANVNNQQVSGLQTFRDIRMAGAMLFDERGSGLGSCCTFDLENINLEGVNNLPTFEYRQTGNGHGTFGAMLMSKVEAFDCTNGQGAFRNSTASKIVGLTIIDSGSCGMGVTPFVVQSTSTGIFQNCRILGNWSSTEVLAVDGSNNPISGCTTGTLYGDLYVSDPTDVNRLKTDLGLSTVAPVSPPVALAPKGTTKQVTVALDPGTCAQNGGVLFNDGSQSGFNTEICSSAPNTLNVAMAQALPPTNFALAAVNNGSGGCGTSSLTSGTYFYNIEGRGTPSSATSAPAGEQSITVNGTQCVNVTWTASGGTNVVDYLIGRNTCAGCTLAGGTKLYASATSPFLDTGAAASAGAMGAYNSSMAAQFAFSGKNFGFSGSKGQHFITQAAGSDVSGTIALTSGTPSTATFTFTSPYSSAPVCVASDQTSASAIKVAPSTTNVVFTGPNSVTDTIAFICVGNPN